MVRQTRGLLIPRHATVLDSVCVPNNGIARRSEHGSANSLASPSHVLSAAAAGMDILYNTLYTSTYVGSLFVLPSARTGGGRLDPRTGRPLTRDSPHVLRTRLVGVGLSSLTSLAIVSGLIVRRNDGAIDARMIARLLGLWKPAGLTWQETVKLLVYPLACTASLFTGPLYTTFLDSRLPGMSFFSWKLDVVAAFKKLTGLRNFVVVRHSWLPE